MNMWFQMIKEPKIALGRLKVIFGLVCFLLALYFSLTQVVRFLANEDTSSISNKQFNLEPHDKYPTFSICLKGRDIYWHKEEFLFNSFGVTSAQYVDTLMGNGQRYDFDEKTGLYNKELVELRNFTLIEFTNVALESYKVIIGAEFKTQQDHHAKYFGKGKTGGKLEYNPFYVGYQTYDEICFTRSSEYESDLIRVHDLISLDRNLLKPGTNLNLEIRIIVHYPGHLIRNFDKPSFRSILGSYINNKQLELKISRVTKLSKRPDSNVKCNPDLENDDEQYLKEVVNGLKCVPPYWSHLQGIAKLSTEMLRVCKTPEMLQNATNYVKHFKQVLGSYESPCVDMKSMVTFSRELDQLQRQFLIKVVYPETVYQEIKNVRDFTFETFWSTAGGYLGFFLGYSLLQIPELLHGAPSYFRSMQLPTIIGMFYVE